MASNTSEPGEEDTTSKPLWKYVMKLDPNAKSTKGGGNIEWKCNLCRITKKTSYTRVRAHLLKIPNEGIAACNEATPSLLSEMRKLEDQAQLRAKQTTPKKVPLPTDPSFGSNIGGSPLIGKSSIGTSFFQGGSATKKRKGDGGSANAIEKAFNLAARDQLHAEIARMFYSAGLPFHLARNPYFVSSYSFAANNPLSGYLPPGYNMLRTTILQREKANIERLLQPIKGTWKEKGVSIVSDGWSDSQKRPLINVMAVTESGPMFLKAVDCSGETKDKYFIADLLKEVLNEVGYENVVQIITDNASNCKGAGQIIEAQYPTVVWTPCVVHTLNLALKNICAAKNVENNQVVYEECVWIAKIHHEVMQNKHFINNHSMRLAMFNEFVPLKLLSVAETRFASVIVMLKRFKLIKRGLQALVISENWSLYRDGDVESAQAVKEKVLDDLWWDKIDYLLSFTNPIYDMLRACDTDRPCLQLVYDMWDSMIEKVKTAIYRHENKQHDEVSSFYNVVYEILVDRWNKNNTPLHCLAHSLNPRYYSEAWLNEDPNRVPPHKDLEVSRERTKCLKKYFPTTNERQKVLLEYANFSTKAGDFEDIDSIHDLSSMDPKSWWGLYMAHLHLSFKVWLSSYLCNLPHLLVVSEIGVRIPLCIL